MSHKNHFTVYKSAGRSYNIDRKCPKAGCDRMCPYKIKRRFHTLEEKKK